MRCNKFIPVVVFILLVSCVNKSNYHPSGADWAEYLGGPDRNHYSTLSQIDTSNVMKLEQAWEYHTGDSGQVQCNPLIVDGVLYGVTAATIPFALDAATGREIWKRKDSSRITWYSTLRGMVYWKNPEDADDKRILYTYESDLLALNAMTGAVITGFGDSGRVSLREGLGEGAKDKMVISNTPGTVFEDLIIMPLRLSEGADAAPGYIQAFHIRTGKLAWVFKTIPGPGEQGYETWPADAYKNIDVGAANNWAGMAIDRERGIVYVPTGSAAFDFYGGNRKGDNLFANTLLALDARTGKRIWHFQAVRHDILDRDFPAPPNLVTVEMNGRKIDAVAQLTKHGFVFLFDRENGKPLFEIKEVAAPASDMPGESAATSQPLPVKPAPYARQSLTAEDISPYAENRDSLINVFNASRFEGPFTPLSRKGTIIYPGLDGGAEWGGAAVDPKGIMYVNSNEMAWWITLDENTDEPVESGDLGARVYADHCAVCHGKERKGNAASGFPELLALTKRQKPEQTRAIVSKGKGMMPAFAQLSKEQTDAVVAFLHGGKTSPLAKEPGLQKTGPRSPYKISGYTKFLDKAGYPAIRPPWGTLNAIDLNTGEYLWKITYGEYPELTAKGIPQTGSESYGGPVVTAGGVLFIAGTKDGKFRAYNKRTGKLLFETKLPSASFATPSTYKVNGRQYVVLACGGTKLNAPKGDSYVAFALPASAMTE
jgi:quinoprotein glucose dehydrogenase